MTKSKQSISDQIFDFLFNIQVSKKRQEIKRDKKFGEFGNSLLEIGAQPAMYPVGVTLQEIKKLLEQESSIQMGNEKRFSTGLFTPPSELSKMIKSQRQKKNNNTFLSLWASIGGNLDANGDGALLAMLSKKFNITSEEATELGRFYKNIKKEENKLVTDKALWGKDFMPSKQDANFPDLDIEFLGEEYINERKKKKDVILSKSRNILLNSVLDTLDIKKEDNTLDHETKWSAVNSPVTEWLDEPKIPQVKENVIKDSKIEKEEILKVIEDSKNKPQEEKVKKLSDFFEERGVNNRKASLYSHHLLVNNPDIWDDENPRYLQSSQDSLFKALTFHILSDRAKQGNISLEDISQEYEQVENNLRAFINNNKSTYGVKFQRVLLTKRFIESSANFSNIFLSGDWEKFETEGLGFTQVVKRVEVKDSEGNVVGSYVDHGDSVIGKLLGRAYYLHPKNFINGILNNGELWLKLACGEDKKLNKKSLAYALYNLTPGRLIKKGLNQITRPFNFIGNTLRTKILNPFFGKILKFSKTFLRKFLGATGIGGFIASTILHFLGDKFESLIIQIVQVFLIGLLGLLFAIFFSFGSINNNAFEISLTNQYTDVSDGETFSDLDWEIDKGIKATP